MALKFIIQKLDDVEESLRPMYKVRNDGRYQLDAEGAEAADDVAGLKTALAKEKEEQLVLKQRLEGLTKGELAELKKLKKEKEDAEREKLEKDGNFEAVKTQMIAKHNEELAAVQQNTAAIRRQLEKVLISDAATQAIVDAKGNPKLLGPIVRGAMQLTEVNGEFSVQIVGSNGQPLVSDAKGTPMSVTQYVESLKAIPDYQPAFAASGSSGGGSSGGGSDGGDTKNKPLSKWTPEEKRDFIISNGSEAFRDLVASQKSA